ncbi:MAG: bifunctional diaminohydroxyphosphoribosylaminopyrimidine deaminase/5-amino-6-(5-phosphoribosylamino)uracil reductase RibD [Flavobacteriaceae bacterium]|nr:bifunctional diaminohydroxyphosphoribosylaminopyrimidine deaminase/5-amino-6-(5-phosphoribosylamino)uracil reductase RibD [Flavobacteriaceae bacterium]
MKIHEKYMLRCIQLAKNGLGTTYPNPLVGSVIVHKNKIIGEGWHYKSGKPHAEVNAINSVKNKTLLEEATIYVSLEPCSHFGKTPPCANLIIEKGIKNVVIGSVDPNPKVTGNGINLLKESGCNLIEGVLQKECNQLNKRFFTIHQKKRPYIILKWAETGDGFIAPKETINRLPHLEKNEIRNDTAPVWITNPISRQLVHKWRAEEQSILVGTQTVIDDNPSLTTRDWQGNSPIRFVIDRNLRIPENASVFDGSVKTIVIVDKDAVISTFLQAQCTTPLNDRLTEKNILIETINFSKEIATQICDLIYRYNIQSIIIEGGAKTLQSFIDANLWDEARVFTGNNAFKEGTKAPVLRGSLSFEEKINQDILRIYTND